MKRINWDYTITNEDIEAVMNGEQEYAGHWDPEYCQKLRDTFFPLHYLDDIKWITTPDKNRFQQQLKQIADDILFGRDNSVYEKTSPKLENQEHRT